MSTPIPIEIVVAGLAGRAHELCLVLLPNGTKEGHEFRVGSVAGEPGRSMAVHLGGGRAGVWSDFSSGETGDALDLVAAVLHHGDKKQAFAWARDWLGLGGAMDSAAIERHQAAAKKLVAKARQDAAEAAEQNRGNALRIYTAAQQSVLQTPVDHYLLGRAIDLRALGRQPRALRYHPELYNKESGRRWPAMIALVTNGIGQPIAVHRTFLEIQRDGRVTKAPLTDPKLTLGPWRGGSIKLWRGASLKPLGQAPAGELVDLTEGLEDGLSVAMGAPECRVLVAINVANFATVELPEQIGGVRIWRQNDAPDSKAAAQVTKAIDAHLRAGRRVLLADVPAGVKDVNDLLRTPAQRVEEGVA